jgi:hypothetical protein
MALRDCMEAASEASHAPLSKVHVAGFSGEIEGDAARGRAGAAMVLRIALDHVGVPRGNNGKCLVLGRIDAVLRGSQLPRGGGIGLSIPCTGLRGSSGPGTVWMGDLNQGSFANVFLTREYKLIDYQPVRD